MYIKVRVAAGVKKELFTKVSNDSFQISVKEPAEQNRANIRVRELLANYFTVPLTGVRFVSGHHSPHKIFNVLEKTPENS